LRIAGTVWVLQKRSADADAPFHLTGPMRNGQRLRQALHHSTIKDAEAEAKPLIQRWLDGWRKPVEVVKPVCATFAQIIGRGADWPDDLGVVSSLPITANADTRRSYVWSLRWCARLALGVTDEQVDALRVDVLNKDFARKFFGEVMRRANLIESQGARSTWLRTATGFWRNARCLFAPMPLDAMCETHKLVIPATIEDFRKGQKLFLADKVDSDSDFERPPDAVVRATWREWLRLGVTPGYSVPGAHRYTPEGQTGAQMPEAPLSEMDRRNAFIVVGLALSCALRIDEIMRARWEWFRVENRHPLLCEYAVNVKSGRGVIRVKPLNPFWRTLNRIVDRNGWRGQPGEYCLAERAQTAEVGTIYKHGGKSDRLVWPKVHVSRWMRRLGWTTQKSNHALRDLACSWVTMKFGLDRACIFARHGQSSTTARHYNRFVDADVMDDPKRLAWLSWAK
jgi:integrase